MKPIRKSAYRILRRRIAASLLLVALVANFDVLRSADPLHPAELNAFDTVITKVEVKPYVKPETPEDYIKEVFGKDADDAFAILSCENKALKQEAINYNRNGSTDHGIFQINSVHTKRFGEAFKHDWRENIKVARKLQQEQGWYIWSCSHVINITPFWQR